MNWFRSRGRVLSTARFFRPGALGGVGLIPGRVAVAVSAAAGG